MKKKINLYWYRHKDGHGNFGDELNPYIISRISGLKIRYVNGANLFDNKWLAIKELVKSFRRKKIKFGEFLEYSYYNLFKMPSVIYAIGSILESSHSPKNIIWGSGIIHTSTNNIKGRFFAVRGKYTQQKLKELHINTPDVMGDPALLLPLLYNSSVQKKFKIGIIPHYQHYHTLQDKFSGEILVINLLDDIETIIQNILSCELIYSTSLHGIIVSHAYKIPALWVEFRELQNNRLKGDNVKFKDYLSSVDLPFYNPLQVRVNDFLEIPLPFLSIDQNRIALLPDPRRIQQMQLDLLRVAPFYVLQKYLR